MKRNSFRILLSAITWIVLLLASSPTPSVEALVMTTDGCRPIAMEEVAAQQFKIGQPTLPTVKHHQFRLKPTPFGLFHHVLKMIILTQAILSFVVKSKIAGQPTFTIRPHQRDQIDPLYHSMMLTRPVSSE